MLFLVWFFDVAHDVSLVAIDVIVSVGYFGHAMGEGHGIDVELVLTAGLLLLCDRLWVFGMILAVLLSFWT